jgi:hypothetical protein
MKMEVSASVGLGGDEMSRGTYGELGFDIKRLLMIPFMNAFFDSYLSYLR